MSKLQKEISENQAEITNADAAPDQLQRISDDLLGQITGAGGYIKAHIKWKKVW